MITINLLTWRPEDEGMYSQIEYAERYLSQMDEADARAHLVRRGREVRKYWQDSKDEELCLRTEAQPRSLADALRKKIELRRAAMQRAARARDRAHQLTGILGVAVPIRGKLAASSVDKIARLVEDLRVLADAEGLDRAAVHAMAQRIRDLRDICAAKGAA